LNKPLTINYFDLECGKHTKENRVISPDKSGCRRYPTYEIRKTAHKLSKTRYDKDDCKSPHVMDANSTKPKTKSFNNKK